MNNSGSLLPRLGGGEGLGLRGRYREQRILRQRSGADGDIHLLGERPLPDVSDVFPTCRMSNLHQIA